MTATLLTATLLTDWAAALHARAAAEPGAAERQRAAILLEDFSRCRDAGPASSPGPVWADSAPECAAAAALAARDADRDDVHWASLTHPGSVIWPVVTVLGDVTRADGRRRLAAAVTGYTAMTGLALALGPQHGAVFHSTATAGTVGSAAATAVLLDLAPDRWSHALGHALSVMGGSRGALIEYSGTRGFHSAHAVRTAIAAALAADRGLDATAADLDRRQGALAGLDPALLAAGADDGMIASSLRVFPTSGVNQTAYESAWEAARRSRGRITGVVIRTAGNPPPAVTEAVTAAVVDAGRAGSVAELPNLIELQPQAGTTSVWVQAEESSAKAGVDTPLDHPDRPADLERIATVKWRCPAAEAEAAVAQRVEDFGDGRIR